MAIAGPVHIEGEADQESGLTARTRWAARLYSARYSLTASAFALLACSLFWEVPLAFTVPGMAAILVIAGLLPRRRVNLRTTGIDREGGPWPDSSMKATVEALPTAAFILDSQHIVRFANGRAARLFPTTRAGDPFRLTFRSPEASAALEDTRRAGSTSMEYRELGDPSRVYDVRFNLLHRPGSSAPHVLVTFDDISDRLAIARMRADFVANASHELRTPLASLTGFIETLLGPARGDPEAGERFLRIMLDQARRMGRLIDDLLSLSRVEMRAHRRPTDTVDLVAILRNVADALSVQAEEHAVSIDLDLPEGERWVRGDRDELVQVFQNLVENAVRYGASGGRVDVGLEQRSTPAGTQFAVSIRDYGPGIAPEHLPRLTERFYRADVASSRSMKGTGLGLAIVKHILTRHHARLEIESELGKGAVFRVEFEADPERSRES